MYNQKVSIDFLDRNKENIEFTEVETLITGDFLLVLGKRVKRVFKLADIDEYSVEPYVTM